MTKNQWWNLRPGLRARVTVMFGLGALALSVLLGSGAFYTTRHYLVSERDSANIHQAFVNAALVRSEVRAGDAIEAILQTADSSTVDSHSLLTLSGTWYARTLSVGRNYIPASLKRIARDGTAVTQTVEMNHNPEIVVAVPLPAVKGIYYEIFFVRDLAHTIRIFGLAIFIAGVLTTALGIFLGRWAASRSLRPLAGVSSAAVAIASGSLSTRLPENSSDPDLAGLTDSFNAMVNQLQDRFERDARFTSDVSHELRSPLTTLSASLEVLEHQSQGLSASGREALNLLGADLRRFQRLVTDLLEISRADTDALDLALEEVDAQELINRSVVAAMRHLVTQNASPQIEIDANVEGKHLMIDKRRFERVMANLIENASLYGGGATKVWANASTPGFVQVGVDDQGPGVKEADRPHIFDRFYRGSASGRRGTGTGTGLGLALVKEHVRLLNGSVEIVDAPGGGARFCVVLPTHTSDEGDET